MSQTVTPDELANLSKSFENFCAKHQVETTEKRENLASLVFMLHGRGVTDPAEIVRQLETKLRVA